MRNWFEFDRNLAKVTPYFAHVRDRRTAITKGFLPERALDLKDFKIEVHRAVMDEPSDSPLYSDPRKKPTSPRLNPVNSSI